MLDKAGLWGITLKKAILYIHGNGGRYLEAEQYKKNYLYFNVVRIDYKISFLWIVQNQIKLLTRNAYFSNG